MKYTYSDEMEWMCFRDRTRKQGFFCRAGHMFRLLIQDSDEQLTGYDLYTVENHEDKSTHIAMTKWDREEIAGQVVEELKTRPVDDAQEFFQFFNTRLLERTTKEEVAAEIST